MKNNEIQTKSTTEMILKNQNLPTIEVEKGFDVAKYSPINLSTVSSLGSCGSKVATEIAKATAQGGKSGLYKVTIGAGETLGKLKNGKGFFSGIFKNGKLTRQANMIPVTLDPTALMAEVALSSVTFQLTKIEQAQEEIKGLIKLDKKTKISGAIKRMEDILQSYNTNTQNSVFKTGNYTTVGNIKLQINQIIDFYEEEIFDKVNKTNTVINNNDIKTKIKNILIELKNYNLALYAHSFACYLEVILSENYDKNNINNVLLEIEKKTNKYNNLIDNYCDKLEKLSEKSIGEKSALILSIVGDAAGELATKTPLLKDTGVGKTISKKSNELYLNYIDKFDAITEKFKEDNKCLSPIFSNNINLIDKICNDKLIAYADENNLYLSSDDNFI